MSEFKQYRRKQISELRHVEEKDIRDYDNFGFIDTGVIDLRVSISDSDKANGSPKVGDMIARNPNNYGDQWLVSKEYYESNFELINKK